MAFLVYLGLVFLSPWDKSNEIPLN